jgi:eukaryotic-like serine/threonine-protein kinase
MPALLDRVTSAFATRYPIERELGQGGMATVYLAHDPKHGRLVAVKVFRPELATSVGAERFLREIQVAARLTHPHILPLHDSGEVDGLLYYVMPYIDGESLRDRLQREHRLEPDQVLVLGREVADALDYAHQHGVVHRDIKPENILIANGEAVIADFGIARAVGSGGELLTEAGLAVGTPMYMSPEQAEGDPDVDGRSDIYSLGCVLFEALAGVPPFQGRTAQAILVRRLLEGPPPLRTLNPRIPVAVEAVIARSLARAPADRFATAARLASALAEVNPSSGRAVAFGSGSQPTAEASVAVLPFVNLSSDPENEYFSDGMTDEIINALAQIPGLRVAARSSSFMFKGKRVEARQIGERLKVRTVLEGSLRRAGDRIRMSVQLINASDGYHLWSRTYERTLADVFALQDELTRAIVGELTSRVAGGAGDPMVRPSTDIPEAYELYLQGCYFVNKRTTEGFSAAIDHFRRAIERDPDYAAAYAQMAYCYALVGMDTFGAMAPLEAMPKAKTSAAKALELNPQLSEAHGAQAIIAALYDWDWVAAEREFQQAVSLGGTSSLVHVWYALFLSAMRRHDESLRVVTTALSGDPLSLGLNLTLGRCLYYARRYGEALAKFRAILELEPLHVPTYWELGRVYSMLKRYSEAAAILEHGMQLAGRLPILLMYAGSAYARLGEHARALGIAAELRRMSEQRYLSPMYEAHIHTALGDRATGFELYEEAYQRHSGWLIFMRGPDWDPVREDPRYLTLLKKVNLDI